MGELIKKGLFTKEQISRSSDELDEMIELSFWLEMFDGTFILILLSNINKRLLSKIQISDEKVLTFRSAYDEFLDADYEQAATLAADLTNQIVDIPGIVEQEEGEIIKGLFTAVVNNLLLKKKKQN